MDESTLVDSPAPAPSSSDNTLAVQVTDGAASDVVVPAAVSGPRKIELQLHASLKDSSHLSTRQDDNEEPPNSARNDAEQNYLVPAMKTHPLDTLNHFELSCALRHLGAPLKARKFLEGRETGGAKFLASTLEELLAGGLPERVAVAALRIRDDIVRGGGRVAESNLALMSKRQLVIKREKEARFANFIGSQTDSHIDT